MQKLQQFYVLKFNSSRLKKCNYDIKIDIKTARKNDEIISLGDNQVLRSIRKIKVRNIDFDFMNGLFKEGRKLTRKRNCIENKKRIRQIDKDIDNFEHAKQHFSDCYLMTTLETLSHTPNGRKVLKEQIQYDDNNPKLLNCYLYKENGEKEKYTVPTNAVVIGYEMLYRLQPNVIIRSMDVSVAEYENKYKSKPWICRVTDTFKSYSFENNLPSHFMKVFTGIEPRVIAETDFNLDLSGYKNEVMELFKRMDKEKNHSFVIGTGVKMLDVRTWQVYIIEDVDLANNTITVKEKRGNTPRKMNIDTALNTFKFVVGYFNSDLGENIKKESQQ